MFSLRSKALAFGSLIIPRSARHLPLGSLAAALAALARTLRFLRKLRGDIRASLRFAAGRSPAMFEQSSKKSGAFQRLRRNVFVATLLKAPLAPLAAPRLRLVATLCLAALGSGEVLLIRAKLRFAARLRLAGIFSSSILILAHRFVAQQAGLLIYSLVFRCRRRVKAPSGLAKLRFARI